jgi:hypothetical protein
MGTLNAAEAANRRSPDFSETALLAQMARAFAAKVAGAARLGLADAESSVPAFRRGIETWFD